MPFLIRTLLAFSCSGFAAAGDTDVVRGDIAKKVHAELERREEADTFSGAVIVELGGELVLDAGYGAADREAQAPFTTDTIAQIGSITKVMTGLAVVDLAMRDRLSFDAQVQRYLPEAPEPAASLTLHQLLTHTGGTSEYCGGDDDDVDLEGLFACLAADLKFVPGSQYEYSNTGYQLLAAIVERVSGEPIDAYLKRRLFQPHGMKDTGYVFADDGQRKRLAAGYLNGRRSDPISERLDFAGDHRWSLKGAGGIQSSARDMLALKRALAGQGALSTAMIVTALTERFARSERLGSTYTFGQIKNKAGAAEQFSFAGSDGVFFAYFRWRPEAGQFLYLVGNAGEEPTLDAARAVMKTLDAVEVPTAD